LVLPNPPVCGFVVGLTQNFIKISDQLNHSVMLPVQDKCVE